MDGARAPAALTPTQPSAEVIRARGPSGAEGKDRTRRTRRREDRLDEDRPDPGSGFAAADQHPNLACGSLALPSLSDLNRLVRTRRRGGVGAGEGDLPGYPI